MPYSLVLSPRSIILTLSSSNLLFFYFTMIFSSFKSRCTMFWLCMWLAPVRICLTIWHTSDSGNAPRESMISSNSFPVTNSHTKYIICSSWSYIKSLIFMIYGEFICFKSSISFITSLYCILYFCCAIFKSTNLIASRMSVCGIEHWYTTPKLPSPNFFSIFYFPAIISGLLDLGLKYFNSSAMDILE